MMRGIVITCVSPEEGFTQFVYEYLYAELEKQQRLDGGKNLRISSGLVKFVPDNNEIHVHEGAQVPNAMIKWILESLTKTDRTRFKDYEVIQFGDTFTIGRLMQASDMGLYSCDICSYSTPYEAELYTHRMTHFGI